MWDETSYCMGVWDETSYSYWECGVRLATAVWDETSYTVATCRECGMM